MAETSYFWDNAGTGDSPAGGYGHDEMMTEVFRMLLNGTGNQGVLAGWLNELEVTDGGGLDAAVDTGGAIVYGFFYENDAAATVTLPDDDTNHVVVECGWAAQTARLKYVAALTQTDEVTWDIPLAEVTTVGGSITNITDERDYCLFSTILQLASVGTSQINTDAVTIAKLINQDRWFWRGAGTLEPDATNPATWAAETTYHEYGDHWNFADSAVNAIWLTFRVPADFTGSDLTVYLHDHVYTGANGTVDWGYDAWIGAASAVLANDANTATQTFTAASRWDYGYRHTLATLSVSAGDLVHMQIYRDGTTDTIGNLVALLGVFLAYTADS